MELQEKYNVFISSKSEDYAIAREVYKFLAKNKVSAFLACEELKRLGESHYADAIDKALDNCKHMIVIASSLDYINSKYVHYEWSTFSNDLRSEYRNGNLLNILGPQIKLKELPAGLRHQQSFRFNNYKEEVLSYLVNIDIEPNNENITTKDNGVVKEERKPVVKHIFDNLKNVAKKQNIKNELPNGYSFSYGGDTYRIITIKKKSSYYICYKIIRSSLDNHSGLIKKFSFDMYEYCDSLNHRRNNDNTISAIGDTSASKLKFLNLCKKKTNAVISTEFLSESHMSWITFSINNTLYLIDTHYRKPFPWKKFIAYVGGCIASAILIYSVYSLSLYVKEKAGEKDIEMSPQINNDNSDAIDFPVQDAFEEETVNDKELIFDSLFNAAEMQYKDKQYTLAKETIYKMDSEYHSKKQVKDLINKIDKSSKDQIRQQELEKKQKEKAYEDGSKKYIEWSRSGAKDINKAKEIQRILKNADNNNPNVKKMLNEIKRCIDSDY